MIPHSRPTITEHDVEAVRKAMESSMLATGDRVEAFEIAAAAYAGMQSGVACSSGTAALIISMLALNLGHGDEIILPTYVCRDVLQAVMAAGATPVLVDLQPDWRQSSTSIIAACTKRTAAIVVVHVFGFVSSFKELTALSVPIISDSCQAFGAQLDAKPDIQVCSFHATKCLTTGVGGMCLFRDQQLAARARAIRDDSPRRLPSGMSDIQAQLGLSQLVRYGDFVNTRRAIAGRYSKVFSTLQVTLPTYRLGDIPFRFPIRTGDPFDKIASEYAKGGVTVRRGVDQLLHRIVGLADEHFPVATELFHSTVSIPIYPSLSELELNTICSISEHVFAQ